MSSVDLQSQDHRNLLDIVDKLRSLGINRYIDLPQIIVCGDQSAGKSSVLEAISGLSFPTKDNLCTRFPTELVLRRHDTPSAKASIIPASDSSKEEIAKLSKFHHDIDVEKPDLATVVEAAKTAMGLSESKIFSTDILRIELKGPQQPHLTLVDLPGLFRASNRDQSVNSAPKVHDMVHGYLQKPRSIILAVVSAQSDFALQPITELSRELDKTGSRTLGLITKPDTLPKGSDSEASYITLAQNKDVVFRLGWHVLRNRSFETRHVTSAERDQNEREFFATGAWSTLDPGTVGIQALRTRLSKVLKNQILTQLPSLTQDVSVGISECQGKLNALGTPRETLIEQRRYLRQVSSAFSELMRAAVDGHYSDPFFGDASTELGYNKRFRSVVQNELELFAENMHLKGKNQVVIDNSSTMSERTANVSRCIDRADYLEHVRNIMRRSRGRELPGTFNPLIVSELFREQCRPWHDIISEIEETVLAAVRLITNLILEQVAVRDTIDALQTLLDQALDGLALNVKAKISEVLRPHMSGHPITYDKRLIAAVRELRDEDDDELDGVQAAEMAVDYMQAYYMIAIDRVIDNVGVLAIEEQMIRHLPLLFDADKIDYLSEDQIANLAAESESVILDRTHYTEKMNALETAKQELRRLDRYRADSAKNVSPSKDESLPRVDLTAADDWVDDDSKTMTSTPSPKPKKKSKSRKSASPPSDPFPSASVPLHKSQDVTPQHTGLFAPARPATQLVSSDQPIFGIR